jgi:hypothetical protein
MRNSAWRSLEILSALLGDDERDHVLGDIQERGPDIRAVLELLGLVLLRQLQAWTSCRMWLATMTLTLPALAITLSVRAIGDTASYYPWPNVSEISRFEFAWMIANSALATLALTWSTGYALATIARYGSLLPAAVLTLGAIAVSSIPLLQSTAPHIAWIRTLAYMLCAILPGLLGIRRGWRGVPLTRRSSFFLAIACIPFAFLLPNSPFWSTRLISVLAFWPAYYALGFSMKRKGSHA